MGTKKIVILGAGYAGVQTAKILNKGFKKQNDIEITIIDKNPYHTLLTELHEVAGSRVEPDSVQIDLKKIFNATKVNIVTDKFSTIDFEKQTVKGEKDLYKFDYLVVGIGSEPADFGVPGVKENGFTIWSHSDAMKIREHVEKMFLKASTEKDASKRREMLTFVVAGAGFTGIETIGELAEWKKRLCKEYYIDPKEVNLMVVEAMGKILPILNDKLIAKSERYLSKLNVKLMTNSPITNVNKDSIVLKDGKVIKTNTLIWTCGVQGSECALDLGLRIAKRCRIEANQYMQTPEHENVYVVGDIAYLEENGKPLPQIVETALQTAETAAHNIAADIEKKQKESFKSNYHGFMVSIGSHYAVADVMGMSMSGFMAMAMKHLVNLHYLFGVAGFNAIWTYIMHEFFDVKDNKSMIRGHVAKKSPTFWIAILRVYMGVLWLIEGINKVREGWLNPKNIHIVSVAVQKASDATSGATQAAGSAAQAVTQAAVQATTAATGAAASGAASAAAGAGQAAAQAASSFPTPLLSKPPAIFQWFMNTFIAPHAFIFQAMVVCMEIAIGLALIAGLFTVLASIASIFLSFNFILSAMADKSILWYIFGGIALIGGAGRAFGLDYYVMPWLKNWWNKTRFARSTYLYIGKPNIH